MTKNFVIPTGAERSEAQWRDLFCGFSDKRRSLDYAAPSTSLGQAGGFARDDGINAITLPPNGGEEHEWWCWGSAW
jgi:hypothetical protein